MGSSPLISLSIESTMAERSAIHGESEDQFFDSREDLSSASDSCPDDDFITWAGGDHLFDAWVESPCSVGERRSKFMQWMGLDITRSPQSQSVDGGGIALEIDRITSDCGVVLRSSGSDNAASSCWLSKDAITSRSSEDSVSDENSAFRITSLDDGSVYVLNAFREDGGLRSLREVGSNRVMTLDEFNRSFGPSLFVQSLMRRDGIATSSSETTETMVRKGRRMGWLKRLGVAACVVNRQVEESSSSLSDSEQSGNGRVQRVKVRLYRKRFKEFSALYRRQDIGAHDGAILTMKFSPDGQYLASGGEDVVVRVWQVMECEQTGEDGVLDDDPSCIYFRVNHNSELVPLSFDKEKKGKSRSMRRTSDSACIVIPPEVFQISEKPVHEFHGHSGDVLDFSWSKDKYLLSSSADKTVRLWQVGCNSCLKIFSHNDYVTSVQFNPVEANYFISGSIDGKVRIWEVSDCRVVDWTDIKDIVTVVCYCPDGKGVVVGSMAGDCRFYDASDNLLQLDAQISLWGKKKSPSKRITGFQFCPTDHRKLMVTSADSQVRIFDGIDVISKYKGLKNAGSQISASFTSDGRHIISASEDSNVYIWNHSNQHGPTSQRAKSTWSCERFLSNHASVAIPWHVMDSTSSVPVTSEVISSQQEDCRDYTGTHESDLLVNNTHYLSPTGSFTLSQEFFSESLPKGSATWPEEKLPSSSSTTPVLCKSQYKFLTTSCQNASHSWGQVIVTGGWDGRIRSFQNYGLPVLP